MGGSTLFSGDVLRITYRKHGTAERPVFPAIYPDSGKFNISISRQI